jgi:hypothetical protein
VTLTAISLDQLDFSIKRAIAHGGGRLEEATAGTLTYWQLVGNRLLCGPLPVLRHIAEEDEGVEYVPGTVSPDGKPGFLLRYSALADTRPDLLRAMENYECDGPDCRNLISLAHAWDLAALHLAHGTAGLCLACAKRAAARKAAA